MRIRLAKVSDFAAIAACEALAFDVRAPGAAKSDSDSHGVLASQIRAGAIHLIADAARVLGYISCTLNSDHLFINTVAVFPRYHRKGLGSRLLNFAENKASQLGLQHVSLFTDGKINGNLLFYRHRGYSETDRCEERNFCRVYFSKPIVDQA